MYGTVPRFSGTVPWLQVLFHLFDICLFCLQQPIRKLAYIGVSTCICVDALYAFGDAHSVALDHHFSNFGRGMIRQRLESGHEFG